MTEDEARAQRAIAVAARSRTKGNHPFGATLVDSMGALLLEAENTVVTSGSRIDHAEMNLISRASALYEPTFLELCTMYASCEPCAMCAAASYWSGIGRIVYALSKTELDRLIADPSGKPSLAISCRDVLAAGRRKIEIVGPLSLPEAHAVHWGFWRQF